MKSIQSGLVHAQQEIKHHLGKIMKHLNKIQKKCYIVIWILRTDFKHFLCDICYPKAQDVFKSKVFINWTIDQVSIWTKKRKTCYRKRKLQRLAKYLISTCFIRKLITSLRKINSTQMNGKRSLCGPYCLPKKHFLAINKLKHKNKL